LCATLVAWRPRAELGLRITVTEGPAMQLWWSTIISSPSRTSVPVTIGEPQRHHGADKNDRPTRAAVRPRAQPQPALPISVCPLVVRVRQAVGSLDCCFTSCYRAPARWVSSICCYPGRYDDCWTVLALPIVIALAHRSTEDLWAEYGDALRVFGARKSCAVLVLLNIGRGPMLAAALAGLGAPSSKLALS